MTIHAPVTPPDLERRMSRKIETHKGIQLSPQELDLFVVSGAYDAYRGYVAEYQRNQCLQRSARSRSIVGGSLPSIPETDETSKSSGTIPSESANEAHQRVQTILNKGGSPSIGSSSLQPALVIVRHAVGRGKAKARSS